MQVFELSAKKDTGMEACLNFLKARLSESRTAVPV
jgi:hypothetical protein